MSSAEANPQLFPFRILGRSLIQPRNCNSKLPLFLNAEKGLFGFLQSALQWQSAMQCKAAGKRMERDFSGGFPDILQHPEKMSPLISPFSCRKKQHALISKGKYYQKTVNISSHCWAVFPDILCWCTNNNGHIHHNINISVINS